MIPATRPVDREPDTASVCPVCLRRLDAWRVVRGDTVFLVKRCPEHGDFTAPVWRGQPDFSAWKRPKRPSAPRRAFTAVDRGCPFDCGLCPEHGQHTCTALIEVTARCDLGCPVCFASSGPGNATADPPLSRIAFLLDRVGQASGRCNLQISGGEPALRSDLPAIGEMAKARGFPFVQLNTNGLRLAADADFARSLAGGGFDSVFLQFDAVTDEAYRALRGRPLFDLKKRAVAAAVRAGLGVVLVPTVIPGINDGELGDIVRLALSFGPGVRGVHIQPAAAFGRHPWPGRDDRRLTLPEVMAALVRQSQGLLRLEDFHPPGCEHSLCSFSAVYQRTPSGGLTPAPKAGGCCDAAPAADPILAEEGARRAKAFTAKHWAAPGPDAAPAAPVDDFDRFLAKAATGGRFTLSGMAFMDAWTLDLERVRGCCIHEVSPEGLLIPFCLYNLSASDGRTLYRPQPGGHGRAGA
ncbi:radical SAM protein [Desulfovibrio sulfodismutans]|uniref:Radical SAM protein n=1 Tax=Desulfolutivibrio sulfodismutans TaxID=63561 RepID=A0A7K3NNV2_9BACT|nr:radical SAM (seleno)protein TrsS [Desulfolutivibrio sulfodismutans]NDY57860.1 radical SAM protein [Desulfolutivibrio sulfodismutans]QLA14396.1 radical SAM protein [Desulfolutivibrio sulfodismutans DSM 3696]